MMTTISDKDRTEAQAMAEAFHGGALAALSNSVPRWLAVRDHVLAAHECPTVPVWRPTTRDEIQPGWEVRSRGRKGSEARWGVAHHQNYDGDWFTESHVLLTNDAAGWTYETTAPLPDPEPDPRIRVVVEWSNEPAASTRAEAAVELLARLDALTKGEQS